MSRQKGSANFAGTIEVQAGGPIDARSVVGTVADLTASATFDYFYEGMQVYVKEDKKTYKLIGGNPTAAANWEEVGAGEEITIDSIPTSGSTNAVSSGGVYNSLGGKADLVDGKIPASQLPAGFDNYDEYDSQSAFPVTGESDKIYVAKNTNLTYRWTGSAYVTIGGSDLALGETSSTAYRGDRGKIAYDDSQTNKGAIGTLANLATTVKTNLVVAINEIKNSLTSVATSGSFNDLVNRPTKDVTDIDTITPLPETPIKLLTVANKIDKANIYSTAEQIVGQWIDGKPLYQKTVDCGAGPNNTTKNIAHGISNIGKVCDIKINMTKSTTSFAFPDVVLASSLSLTQNIRCYVTGDNVIINSQQRNISDMYIIVTLQYTKTTDSAMPVGTDTDYSTSEKIVGSWIDGKKLYQKIVSVSSSLFKATTAGTKKTNTVAHNISNVRQIITCDAFLIYANGGCVRCSSFIDDFGNYFDIYADNTNIGVTTSSVTIPNWVNTAYALLQYTKTTD